MFIEKIYIFVPFFIGMIVYSLITILPIHQPNSISQIDILSSNNECSTLTPFLSNNTVLKNDSVNLFGPGFIRFYYCKPGSLSFQIANSQVDSATPPLLTVMHNNQWIINEEIVTTTSYKFYFNSPGWVTVSFLNPQKDTINYSFLKISKLKYFYD